MHPYQSLADARSAAVRATISHRDQSSIPATVNTKRDIAVNVSSQHLLANLSGWGHSFADVEIVAHQFIR